LTVAAGPTLLFSIDLEDVREDAPVGGHFEERVRVNTDRYLEWLAARGITCTFFVVGKVAQQHAALVRDILSAGHEVACHSNLHRSLDELDPDVFIEDTRSNLEHLAAAGATDVRGYRAPRFSMTAETSWAHEALAELGFEYSSSVLPARNPLFGWPEFGQPARLTGAGVLELPITVSRFGPVTMPPLGGVYLRLLPGMALRRAARRAASASPDGWVLSYLHPYDIDEEQERWAHVSLNGSRLMNRLMYYNRRSVFPKLDRLLGMGFTVTTYREAARRWRADDGV